RVFLHPPPPTALHTLSLHDALPIYGRRRFARWWARRRGGGDQLPVLATILWRRCQRHWGDPDHRGQAILDRWRDHTGVLWCRGRDRKSTRLNSSHQIISYAVFCLKK